MSTIKLALLYGGKSGEHEISLISAASVLANLNSSQYNIIPIGMDKDGQCYLNDYQELLNHKKFLPVKTKNSKILTSLIKNGNFAIDADIVFPVVHGPLYEDGAFQGMLELANIPYVGCGVLSSAIGMDKDIARRIVSLNGVKSAGYRLLSWSLKDHEVELFCEKAIDELGGLPLFVKPCSLGSSVGIHKVDNMSELLNAIKDARRYGESILIEEYIKGREIELAVLENIDEELSPKVSLPGEIKVNHKDGFYSYMAKYLESDKTDLCIPAILDDVLIKRLQMLSSDIFVNLKCKGMARIDFFVDDKNHEIYFNEINTIPGFTTISMYPKLWQESGVSYTELLDSLVNIGLTHHSRRQHFVTHYQ